MNIPAEKQRNRMIPPIPVSEVEKIRFNAILLARTSRISMAALQRQLLHAEADRLGIK